MKGILYKEFTLFRTALIFFAVMTAFMLAMGIGFATGKDVSPKLDETFLGFMILLMCFINFFYMSMVTPTIFKNDESRCWVSFIASSPQSVRGQVGGKYLFIFILDLLLSALWFIASMVMLAVSNGNVNITMGVFICFCLQMLFNAIEIPFIVRFGSEKGGVVKASAIGAVFMAVTIYGLFGDISFLFEDNVGEALLKLLNGETALWCAALLPYISFAAYYLSYRISLKLWVKGTEAYEQ